MTPDLTDTVTIPHSHGAWANASTGIFAVAAFVITAYAFYPGFVSFDSAYQYWQIQHGTLTTSNPIFMTWVWMMLDRVIPGPGGLLLVNLALYWMSLKLMSDVLFRRVWARILFMLILGFWPYNLLLIPNVLKDVCMLTGFMAAVACMFKFHATGRNGWLAGMILFAIYASLMRHNAVAAALPLFAYAASRKLNTFKLQALAVIVLTCVPFLVTSILTAMPNVQRQVFWPTLALWDLAQISVREDILLMPGFTVGPGMTTEELEEVLVSWTNATLFSDTKSGVRSGVQEPFTGEQYSELFKAWYLAMAHHPRSYAEHRLALIANLYGVIHYPHILDHAYDGRIVQYRDNPVFEANQTALNRKVMKVLTQRVEAWYFQGWFYVLLSIATFAASLRRRHRPRFQMVLVLSASGLLFTAPLLVLAGAAPIRYHSWLVMSALLATAALISALSRKPGTESAMN